MASIRNSGRSQNKIKIPSGRALLVVSFCLLQKILSGKFKKEGLKVAKRNALDLLPRPSCLAVRRLPLREALALALALGVFCEPGRSVQPIRELRRRELRGGDDVDVWHRRWPSPSPMMGKWPRPGFDDRLGGGGGADRL